MSRIVYVTVRSFFVLLATRGGLGLGVKKSAPGPVLGRARARSGITTMMRMGSITTLNVFLSTAELHEE